MGILTNYSSKTVLSAFQRAGWYIYKYVGSHTVLAHDNHHNKLSIPLGPEISQGTLRAIIRYSGMSVKEFLKHIR